MNPTEDLVLCTKLRDLGCEVVMPWGSPIGTGKGLMNRYALEALRNRLPDTCLVIDAGLGLPSHAAAAMELGYDAVLINTAIARADQPPMMAEAMKDAVAAGRKAYLAHPAVQSELACPSTPVVGMPFWSTDASGKQPLNE